VTCSVPEISTKRRDLRAGLVYAWAKATKTVEAMSRPVFFLAILAILAGLSGGPLRAQGFGALARLDAGASHLRDRTLGGTELVLTLSQGVPYRVFTLTKPNRLVLDFREVDWLDADPAALLDSKRVGDLRFGGFRPGWSRLVAVLKEPMAITTAGLATEGQGGAVLTVALSPVTQDAFDQTAGAPQDPRWDLPPAANVQQPRDRTAPSRPLVVMIDPGHGGIDPGAINGKATEARLVLAMARELRETLRREGGFEVHLTRDSDTFVSLEARVELAHAAKADVFISLHADALAEGQASGATVYTLAEEASDAASAALAERHDRDDLLAGLDLSDADDQVAGVLLDLARLDNTPRSRALAQYLVAGIRNAVGRVHKRPLLQADFSVLKAADIPSVLVEVGFLSNNDDLRNLQDPIWRASMAAGLRDGLKTWALEDAALARLRRQ